MPSILVIEDEPNVAAFIKRGLNEAGYEIFNAFDGQTGIDALRQHDVDLILLDIILPGMDGVTVCKNIRDMGIRDIPILMLTALGLTENVVRGLDAGADDYLVKPFKFKELTARIRALLRRGDLRLGAYEELSIADLTLDRETKTATRNGVEIRLTSTEYRLLEYFMSNQRKVLSRTDLLEHVWESKYDTSANVIEVYVNYLRKKIDRDFEPKLIHTVIGIGYVIKED
jgi:two-component system, OmpR family, copper resistance phosphate regulon response regulator CusR